MTNKLLLTSLLVALVACPQALSQGIGVAWSGPGPSVNVKAFGAFGDLQVATDGSFSSTAPTQLTYSTSTLSATDVGKHLWLDQSPFSAPVLAGIRPDSSCAGSAGAFTNNFAYPFNVYYRITYKSSSLGEGDASVEGFTSIAAGATNQCIKIKSPAASGVATSYQVYLASDALPF